MLITPKPNTMTYFETNLSSFGLGLFRTISGLFWDYFGTTLTPFQDHFGTISGQFNQILSSPTKAGPMVPRRARRALGAQRAPQPSAVARRMGA